MRLSSRIAAIAPVTGSYFPPMALNLNPSEVCGDTTAVPFIGFHGTADATVPFNGGFGGVTGTTNFRLPIDNSTPAEDVIADWSTHNGCAGARQESQVSAEVRLVQYGACNLGAIVQLYAVDGGGHTWPGAVDVPGLGYTTHQISATDLIMGVLRGAPEGVCRAAVRRRCRSGAGTRRACSHPTPVSSDDGRAALAKARSRRWRWLSARRRLVHATKSATLARRRHRERAVHAFGVVADGGAADLFDH